MEDNIADNITLNAGSGGATLATDQNGSTEHYQLIKLVHGGLDSFTLVSTSSGLPVQQQGTWTVANGGTFVVQENGAALTALQLLDNVVRAEDEASGDGHSGVVMLARRTASPANTSGADLDYEVPQMSAGRLWVSATVDAAIPAGTNNIGDVDVLTIAAGDNNIGNVDIVTMPNVTLAAGTNTNEVVGDAAHDAAVAGNPLLMGGVASAAAPTDVSADGDAVNAWFLRNGAQATVLTAAGALVGGDATNGLDVDVTRVQGTVAVTQSGTWTVQPGNTANTTPWLTTNTPATSGGLSTHHLVSAASTNATNIKASAGQVFGWFVYNSNAAARKVAFHNTSGTPTAGASVFMSIVIPPTSGANVEFTNGIAFGTGIGITMVTGLGDSDATAVAANDLVSNIFYK